MLNRSTSEGTRGPIKARQHKRLVSADAQWKCALAIQVPDAAADRPYKEDLKDQIAKARVLATMGGAEDCDSGVLPAGSFGAGLSGAVVGADVGLSEDHIGFEQSLVLRAQQCRQIFPMGPSGIVRVAESCGPERGTHYVLVCKLLNHSILHPVIKFARGRAERGDSESTSPRKCGLTSYHHHPPPCSPTPTLAALSQYVNVLNLSLQQANPGPHVAVQVLVYNGSGVSAASRDHALHSLRSFLSHRYDVQLISPKSLRDDPWPGVCSLLVFPGGRDLPYQYDLAGKANDRIQAWVQAGGRFLGFCAGAYYASSRVEFEIGRASCRERVS